MRQLLRLILCLFALAGISAAQGARSFNGTSDGATLGCYGTQASCNTRCPGCTILPIFVGVATSQITVSFWLWENAWTIGSGSGNMVIDQTLNAAANNAFEISAGGGGLGNGCADSAYFAHDLNGSSTYRIRSFAHPSAAAWHHYVFLMDTTANWFLYIDGVSVSLNNCDFNAPGNTPFGSADGVSVMSRGAGASNFNAGKISQLAIWNVLLTANEAKSLASCTEPWLIRPENLAAYAPFYGVDSPEPSYAAGFQDAGSGQSDATRATLTGTTKTLGPPVCPGVL